VRRVLRARTGVYGPCHARRAAPRPAPPGFKRHVAQWLDGAEQIVLDDCGHVPQVERPEQTIGLLKRFFACVDALGAWPGRERVA
jgi:pimeloyl-ACP methyl ester carboxylesterase